MNITKKIDEYLEKHDNIELMQLLHNAGNVFGSNEINDYWHDKDAKYHW